MQNKIALLLASWQDGGQFYNLRFGIRTNNFLTDDRGNFGAEKLDRPEQFTMR